MYVKMRAVDSTITEMKGLVSERQSKKTCRRWCCCVLIVIVILLVTLAVMIALVIAITAIESRLPDDPYKRAVALLEKYPLIDG